MEAEAQTDPLVPLVTGCHWVSPLNIGWTDSCVPYQATPRCHLWTTDVRSRVARANTLDNPGHSRHRHLGRGAIQCPPHVPPSTLSTQLEGVGGVGVGAWVPMVPACPNKQASCRPVSDKRVTIPSTCTRRAAAPGPGEVAALPARSQPSPGAINLRPNPFIRAHVVAVWVAGGTLGARLGGIWPLTGGLGPTPSHSTIPTPAPPLPSGYIFHQVGL